MNITSIPLADLKRPAKNVRVHPEKQIKELIRSVKMFGQTRPMVVDETYTVLIGNGLMTALERIGEEKADCYVITGLSDAEKKKLMLADNQIQRLGIDDTEVFDAIIAELGNDIDVPGYDEELLQLLNSDVESADEMFSGYGIITDERKEQFAQASERYSREEAEFAAESEQFVPGVPGDQLQRPFQTLQEDNQIPHAAGAEPAAGPLEEATAPTPLQRRYLICPKCGEKIWL